jgi:hypothetical protein
VLDYYDVLLDGFNGNDSNFAANAANPLSSAVNSNGTLTFVSSGGALDGTIEGNTVTDDFTLLYYKGNYSLFDL